MIDHLSSENGFEEVIVKASLSFCFAYVLIYVLNLTVRQQFMKLFLQVMLCISISFTIFTFLPMIALKIYTWIISISCLPWGVYQSFIIIEFSHSLFSIRDIAPRVLQRGLCAQLLSKLIRFIYCSFVESNVLLCLFT
jgi:hypothetical protein